MKHQYHDLILKYAENPAIQIQVKDGNEWLNIDYTPDWNVGEFRESPRTRHVHADLMIELAGDKRTVFETYNFNTETWEIKDQRLANHKTMRMRAAPEFGVGDIVVFNGRGIHEGLEIVVTAIDPAYQGTFTGTVFSAPFTSHPKGYHCDNFITRNFQRHESK